MAAPEGPHTRRAFISQAPTSISRGAGRKALLQRLSIQLTPDKDKAAVAGIICGPRLRWLTFHQHMHALQHIARLDTLKVQDAFIAQQVWPLNGHQALQPVLKLVSIQRLGCRQRHRGNGGVVQLAVRMGVVLMRAVRVLAVMIMVMPVMMVVMIVPTVRVVAVMPVCMIMAVMVRVPMIVPVPMIVIVLFLVQKGGVAL